MKKSHIINPITSELKGDQLKIGSTIVALVPENPLWEERMRMGKVDVTSSHDQLLPFAAYHCLHCVWQG